MMKVGFVILISAALPNFGVHAGPMVILPTSESQLRESNQTAEKHGWVISDLREVERQTNQMMQYRIPKIEFSSDSIADILDFISLSVTEVYTQTEERFVPFQISVDPKYRSVQYSSNREEIRVVDLLDEICKELGLNYQIYGYQIYLEENSGNQ